MGTSRLGNLLVEEGLLTETDRRTIKRESGTQGAAFAKSIVALGLLDEDELAAFLAERTNHRLAPKDLSTITKPTATGAIDQPLLERLEVVPIELRGNTLQVAMADPLDLDAVAQLKFFTGYKIQPVIATFSQIRKCLQGLVKGFKPKQSTLEEFLKNHVLAASARLKATDTHAKLPSLPDKQPIVRALPERGDVPSFVLNDSHDLDLSLADEDLLAADVPIDENRDTYGEFADAALEEEAAVSDDIETDLSADMAASDADAAIDAADLTSGDDAVWEDAENLEDEFDADLSAATDLPTASKAAQESAGPLVDPESDLEDILDDGQPLDEQATPLADALTSEDDIDALFGTSAEPASDAGDDSFDAIDTDDEDPLEGFASSRAAVDDTLLDENEDVAGSSQDDVDSVIAAFEEETAEPIDTALDAFENEQPQEDEQAEEFEQAEEVAPQPLISKPAPVADHDRLIKATTVLNRCLISLALVHDRPKAADALAHAFSGAGYQHGAIFDASGQFIFAWSDSGVATFESPEDYANEGLESALGRLAAAWTDFSDTTREENLTPFAAWPAPLFAARIEQTGVSCVVSFAGEEPPKALADLAFQVLRQASVRL